MSAPELTPKPAAPAHELAQVLPRSLAGDSRRMTRLLASTPDPQFLGQTAFQIRDIGHQSGAKAIQAELDARQEGATEGRA